MTEQNAVEIPQIVEDAPITQIITEHFIGNLEKQAHLYQERYLPLCIKLTNEADWINHGSAAAPKYSLQCSGAEKVCNPLGMVWERPVVTKHMREDDNGKYYEYEIEGVVQSKVLQRYGWFTGNCSSRDQFFNARGNYEEGDIRKAAFSNWLVNAVTRLAGIRDPTPQMLEKAGLRPDKVGKIEYGRARTPDQEADVITEGQVKRLYAIMNTAKVNRERVDAEILRLTGAKSFKEIKKKDYTNICAWVEAGAPEQPPKEEADGSQGSLPGDRGTPPQDPRG